MNTADLRQLTPKKLYKELRTQRDNVAKARIQVQTGREQDTSKIKKGKKTIARIMTVLQENTNKAA